ncbi:MAG: metallophosphoesterase [Proteobacteria bacterium]|nr:metallophosphoesterase [Pseudomonadota bacterium]
MNGTWAFILFIVVVITVYSLLNYYFIRKHRNVVNLRTLPTILLRLVLFTIILTPAATMVFSWYGPSLLATITGFTGYSWLAFLFLFLVIHGVADIVMFAAEKAGFSPTPRLAKGVFTLTMILSISILLYGRHEAQRLEVERIVIQTRKLPSHIKKLTIVQFSDVHFSPIIGEKTAGKLAELVQRENPDIIVSTGDLIDRGIAHPARIIAALNTLHAPLGKYAITGNHEFIAGIEESMEFTRRAGFEMLRNKAVSPGNLVNIVGLDDVEAARFGISGGVSEKEILSGLEHDRYTILLKHQPRIDKNNLKLFDLQLSGHTHSGQIFPFTLIVKAVFPYLAGLYDLDDETRIYVNKGAGTWGPPIRFMASPEIAVIELVNVR